MLVLAVISSLIAVATRSVLCHAESAGGDGNSVSGLVDLDGLHNTLESLDFHLQNFQKRTCKLGIFSHNCALEKLDEKMKAHKFLSSGNSPGKRGNVQGYDGQDVQLTPEAVRDAKSALDDVMEQRRAISTLKRLLHAMKTESDIQNTKRTCSLRLGGHCLTEALDRAATQYYYLKSPESPGRRRRSAGRTNHKQNQ